MQDNDPQETIDSVDYLIKAAGLLPNETYAHKLLKSHLLSKSRKLLHACANQQRTLFNDEEVCRKCTTPWSDTNYSMGIEPIKMRKRRARTVMRTLDTKSKPKRPQISKRLSKEANNIITIQCDLCKNRKKIILWKKSADFNDERVQRQNKQMAVKPIEQPMIIFDNVPHDVTDHASKKRKHKKDKTAGLLYTINKNDKQLQKVVETRKTGTALIAPASKKAGKNKSKLTTSGGQKPKVKMANVMAPSHISKKPSILQLANALKKKNAEPTTTAEQLKKMLN